jgi:hypothetical protein
LGNLSHLEDYLFITCSSSLKRDYDKSLATKKLTILKNIISLPLSQTHDNTQMPFAKFKLQTHDSTQNAICQIQTTNP